MMAEQVVSEKDYPHMTMHPVLHCEVANCCTVSRMAWVRARSALSVYSERR